MNPSYPNIKQSFGLFGLFLLASIGIGIVVYALSGGQGSIGAMIGTLLINFVVIGIALNWKNVEFKYLVEDNSTIPLSHFVVGCFFSFFLVMVLDPLLSLIPMPDWVIAMFEDMIQKNIWSFITIAVVAPITEEFLFRRVILTGLEKNYGARKAILWSAFFFALFHLNPWQGVGAFLIGIVLAWLYLNTRNIWLCIIIHAFNNATAFLAFYLTDNVMFTISDLTGYDYKLGLVVGLSLVSLYFCYKYFDQAFRQNAIQLWNEDPDATEQTKQSDL